MSSDTARHDGPTDDAPLNPAQPADQADIADASARSFTDDFAKLQAELDEARSRALRVMADFQNYQRRALLNEQTARTEGAARVVSSIVGVVDHFDLALTQDPATATAEQIIAGVTVIREELLKVLAQNGVSLIRPAPNDEFTPGRHEAIMQQQAEGIEPGRVVALFQPGYALTTQAGERVIRAAKVSVSP